MFSFCKTNNDWWLVRLKSHYDWNGLIITTKKQTFRIQRERNKHHSLGQYFSFSQVFIIMKPIGKLPLNRLMAFDMWFWFELKTVRNINWFSLLNTQLFQMLYRNLFFIFICLINFKWTNRFIRSDKKKHFCLRFVTIWVKAASQSKIALFDIRLRIIVIVNKSILLLYKLKKGLRLFIYVAYITRDVMCDVAVRCGCVYIGSCVYRDATAL